MAITIQAYERTSRRRLRRRADAGCGTVARNRAAVRSRDAASRAAGTRQPRGPRREPNEAVRAEPATIGTGRARDPLALEVRLLGSLLGQVIAEQAGRELLDLVERVRRTTIRLRRGDDPSLRSGLVAELAGLDADRAEVVVRAFSLYFRLVNLAEERELVRTARRARARAARGRRAGDRSPRPSAATARRRRRRRAARLDERSRPPSAGSGSRRS